MNENSITVEWGEAVVQVSPATDEAVVKLTAEISRLLEWAKALVVQDAEGMKSATYDLTLLANLKRALEEKRKEYVSPLNDYVKQINDAFRGPTVLVAEADTITRNKILGFQKEERRKAEAAAEINRLREEAARLEMQERGELSEPVGLVEVPAPAPTRVQTEVGGLATKKTWKFEVVDFAVLPDDYKLADLVKIRRVVTAGASIPGVRSWHEEGLQVTPRR